MKLYKHQKKQNKAVGEALKKHNHILYGACTGFGKSVVLTALIEKDLKKGLRVLVLAPYRKLIFQLEQSFSAFVPHVVMGNIDRGDKSSGIILSSMDTMNSRLKKGSDYFEGIDKIYIDETHISCNFPPQKSSRMKLLYDKYWNYIQWVGFTATPIKANGYMLEGWDEVVYKYQTPNLIEMGYLANYKYYAPVELDLSSLRTNSLGEYVADDIEETTNTPTAVESVKKVWKKHGKNKKKVLIFASSIKHAELLQGAIKGSFVIHSKLSDTVQMQILEDFKNSTIGTLINVAMLTTGFDDPSVDMLILARPIKSERLLIQCYGRALRLYGNKVSEIYDMCSCYKNGGLPSDFRDFGRVKGEVEEKEQSEYEAPVMRCNLCGEVSPTSSFSIKKKTTKKFIITKYTCPCCGDVCNEKRQDLTEIDKLQEVKSKNIPKLTYQERKEIVRKLVEEFTKAKPSWSHYICTTINASGRGQLLDQAIAKDTTSKTLWKKVMDIFEDSKSNTLSKT